MKRFAGKVVIITGAGTGIGEAIAHKFALEGATLILNGLPDDPLAEVVHELSEMYGEGHVFMYTNDVLEEQHAQACVQTSIDRFGKLDILINNAGMFLNTNEMPDFEVGVFDSLLKNNLRSAFLMTRFALPELQKTRGNIVYAGSEAGFNGLAQNAPYGGTKGFVHSFRL